MRVGDDIQQQHRYLENYFIKQFTGQFSIARNRLVEKKFFFFQFSDIVAGENFERDRSRYNLFPTTTEASARFLASASGSGDEAAPRERRIQNWRRSRMDSFDARDTTPGVVSVCLREKASGLSLKPLPLSFATLRSISMRYRAIRSRRRRRSPRVRCVEDSKWNWRRASEYPRCFFGEMGFLVRHARRTFTSLVVSPSDSCARARVIVYSQDDFQWHSASRSLFSLIEISHFQSCKANVTRLLNRIYIHKLGEKKTTRSFVTFLPFLQTRFAP